MNFIAIYCIVNIKRAVHFFSRHTTQKCWLTCSRFRSRQYYSAYPPHNISKHFKRYICTQFLRTFTLHGTRVVISVPLSTKKSSTASRDSTYEPSIMAAATTLSQSFNHGVKKSLGATIIQHGLQSHPHYFVESNLFKAIQWNQYTNNTRCFKLPLPTTSLPRAASA